MNQRGNRRSKQRRRDRRCQVQFPGSLGDLEVFVRDLSISGFGAVISTRKVGHREFAPGHINVLEMRLSPDRTLRADVVVERGPETDGSFGGRFIDLSDANYRVIEAITIGRTRASFE